jgi:uncharacterized protein (TIGR02145 family)
MSSQTLISALGVAGLAVAVLSPGAGSQQVLAGSTANDQAVVKDIDGNEYPVVTIGQQMWTAENLRVTSSPSGWSITSHFFRDDSASHANCGRLYTWDIAMNSQAGESVQGICPDGWHLPSDADWTQLFEYVDREGSGGTQLLPGGSTGFEALLCGVADYRGNYLYHGEYALFWSSTEVNADRAYHHSVEPTGELGKFAAMKGARIYIRCIKD